MEADDAVLRTRGLDLCITRAGWHLPWSYDQVWRKYQAAAEAAGIGGLGTHALRHTYRTWLDSVGTPVGVQQKLMRHSEHPHHNEHLW